ncbi:MAG: Hsp33 family molecular chaperone [Nitratireductor sp.]
MDNDTNPSNPALNVGDAKNIGGEDRIVPFHIPDLEVRGRAIQLGALVDGILGRHNYPEPVSKLLGEVIVLTVLLGTSLKFEGKFIVQTQTDGPVSLLVVDFVTPDAVRAYADFDDKMLATAIEKGETSSEQLLGKGTLAMTVDQGGHMQRYQGIVALDGKSLEEVAQAYFKQSEQIPTHVRLAVAQTLTPQEDSTGTTHGSTKGWRAGGVLVQFLPEAETKLTVRDISGGDAPDGSSESAHEERDDGWVEAKALVETVSDIELTDPQVGSKDLLFRLFHERGVHAFEGPKVLDKCSCSKERVISAVKSMSAQDIQEALQDGDIESTCQFCNATYNVIAQDLA